MTAARFSFLHVLKCILISSWIYLICGAFNGMCITMNNHHEDRDQTLPLPLPFSSLPPAAPTLLLPGWRREDAAAHSCGRRPAAGINQLPGTPERHCVKPQTLGHQSWTSAEIAASRHLHAAQANSLSAFGSRWRLVGPWGAPPLTTLKVSCSTSEICCFENSLPSWDFILGFLGEKKISGTITSWTWTDSKGKSHFCLVSVEKNLRFLKRNKKF